MRYTTGKVAVLVVIAVASFQFVFKPLSGLIWTEQEIASPAQALATERQAADLPDVDENVAPYVSPTRINIRLVKVVRVGPDGRIIP